jgi:hypothetical protein
VRRENRSLLQATSAVARKSLMNAGCTSSEGDVLRDAAPDACEEAAPRYHALQEYVTACERLGRVPDAALLAAVLAAAQQQ